MNLTDDIILHFLHGSPVIFQDVCLVYSPLLGEIADAGAGEFFKYLSFILQEKPEDKEMGIEAIQLLDQLDLFSYLFALAQIKPDLNVLYKKALKFFLHEEVLLLPEQGIIVVGDPSEKRWITKDNFEDLRTLIGWSCAVGDGSEEGESIEFLPTDTPAVIAYKKRLLELRKRAKRAKRREPKQSSGKNDSKLSDLIASLPIGTNGSLDITKVWDLTYYAFQDQLKRMGWKENFEINSRAALAGAKIDKKDFVYWIRKMTF